MTCLDGPVVFLEPVRDAAVKIAPGLADGGCSVVSMQLRFVLGVNASLVLVAGTGISALCPAPARLGVPRVFTLQLRFL